MTRTAWRAPLVALAPVALAPFVVRWATTWGWIGDVIAIVLPLLAGLALVAIAVLVVARRRWWTLVAPVAVIAGTVANTIVPRLPETGGRPRPAISIVAVNLRWDNAQADGGAGAIVAAGADVVVASELTRRTDAVLRRAFPYRVVTDAAIAATGSGEGVYSRLPLTAAGIVGSVESSLRVQVGGPTPFVLEAVHLPRPVLVGTGEAGTASFDAYHRELAGAVEAATADSRAGPVVLTGDLNLSDRTAAYRGITDRFADAMRTGWASTTYHLDLWWTLLGLRIDHLFVGPRWCSEASHTLTVPGSDHDAIAARVGPCA